MSSSDTVHNDHWKAKNNMKLIVAIAAIPDGTDVTIRSVRIELRFSPRHASPHVLQHEVAHQPTWKSLLAFSRNSNF